MAASSGCLYITSGITVCKGCQQLPGNHHRHGFCRASGTYQAQLLGDPTGEHLTLHTPETGMSPNTLQQQDKLAWTKNASRPLPPSASGTVVQPRGSRSSTTQTSCPQTQTQEHKHQQHTRSQHRPCKLCHRCMVGINIVTIDYYSFGCPAKHWQRRLGTGRTAFSSVSKQHWLRS